MSFDYQPVLRGDRIELRPLRADDYDALYAVAADPLIWAQHPVKDRHEEGGFRAFFSEALASGGALVAIASATGRDSYLYRITAAGAEKAATGLRVARGARPTRRPG